MTPEKQGHDAIFEFTTNFVDPFKSQVWPNTHVCWAPSRRQ